MKSFSVIIPSFNSKKYVERAINSLASANYDKNLLQVLIIDDGSTDGSYEYINNLIKNYKYMKQIKKHNGNWGSVINYVKKHKLVSNDIVSILDSDDWYNPNVFKIVNKYMNNHDLFAGSFKLFNGKKTTFKLSTYFFISKRTITNKKQMNSPLCLPLPFFAKKNLFYNLNDLEEKIPFQDGDYFSQLTSMAKSMRYTTKTIGYYFFNRDNNSKSLVWDDNRFLMELNVCYKLIKNNASECVVFRINTGEFKKKLNEKNIVFKINEKMHFKWLPWYLRWVYFLFFWLKQKRYFKIIRYENKNRK